MFIYGVLAPFPFSKQAFVEKKYFLKSRFYEKRDAL